MGLGTAHECSCDKHRPGRLGHSGPDHAGRTSPTVSWASQSWEEKVFPRATCRGQPAQHHSTDDMLPSWEEWPPSGMKGLPFWVRKETGSAQVLLPDPHALPGGPQPSEARSSPAPLALDREHPLDLVPLRAPIRPGSVGRGLHSRGMACWDRAKTLRPKNEHLVLRHRA